jgi:hypothetical protein
MCYELIGEFPRSFAILKAFSYSLCDQRTLSTQEYCPKAPRYPLVTFISGESEACSSKEQRNQGLVVERQLEVCSLGDEPEGTWPEGEGAEKGFTFR